MLSGRFNFMVFEILLDAVFVVVVVVVVVVVWFVMLCSLIEIYPYFGLICCLHLQFLQNAF